MQREHKLLEVRALVLAVAVGDLERCRLALCAEVIAVQVHRGGVEVGMVRGHGKARQGRHRQLRVDALRAHRKEAIEHASHVIVTEVLGRQLLAEQQ